MPLGWTYDWNFWNISMVPGGKNMDCLESFREKGPGKMAPRAWHPELRTQDLERSWGIVFSFHTARPLARQQALSHKSNRRYLS